MLDPGLSPLTTMDATPHDLSDPDPQHEAQRFQRLVESAGFSSSELLTSGEPDNALVPEPPSPRSRGELKHGQPFMGRAIFDFGRHEEPQLKPPQPIERAPCPLCGEPNRLRHAYCKRCGFRLPWAAQVEGLPELEPRRNRLDHAVERVIVDPCGARCRFCGSGIAPYDKRCGECGRWLSSNWNKAALDAWQPDFDAWNFSQVRGFKSGCLSPIVIVLALMLWRVLA